MIVGECLHLVNSFICSEGKNQNFPCPYKGDFKKCHNCVVVTDSMMVQMNTYGYVNLPVNNSLEVINND